MNNNNNNVPVTYSTEQVASLFKCDEHTVRRWVDEGKIRAYKVGRRWIYKEEDVLEFLNKKSNYTETTKKF